MSKFKIQEGPLVYIVTVNWNGIGDTLELLRSLKNVTYKNFRIIVIDNGSKNSEAQVISKKFPLVEVIRNKTNLGFCYANNQGIKKAIRKGADYILLLNNDVVVREDFLEKLVKFALKNKKRVLTPKILYYNSDKIWAMGGKVNFLTSIPKMIGQGKPSSEFTKEIRPGYISGAALLAESDFFRKVGLFDENYFAYYEDTDLSFRGKKAGYELLAIPKAVIWHKVSKSTEHESRFRIGKVQSYLLARNGLIFGHKNFQGFKKFYYFLAQYFIKLPLYLTLKSANFVSATHYLKGVVDGTKFVLSIDKSPVNLSNLK